MVVISQACVYSVEGKDYFRTVLPVKVCNELGIRRDCFLIWEVIDDDSIVLRVVRPRVAIKEEF